MKKKLSFWLKLKFIFHYFHTTKCTGTIVSCNNCGSTRIIFEKGTQLHNMYLSKYECKDCGATATCIEKWNRPKE